MEIEGTITEVFRVDVQPDVLFFEIRYGFLNLRKIVLWADMEKATDVIAADIHSPNAKIGIRYDAFEKEILGVWELQ